jgi:hypothetical protein
MEASRPARLCRRASTNIKPADSRYDRRISGGQVTVEAFVQPILISAAKEKYGMELQLAQARMQKAIQQRLAGLPEHKRSFADKSIKKILERY